MDHSTLSILLGPGPSSQTWYVRRVGRGVVVGLSDNNFAGIGLMRTPEPVHSGIEDGLSVSRHMLRSIVSL